MLIVGDELGTGSLGKVDGREDIEG